jgi:hypothetical protein
MKSKEGELQPATSKVLGLMTETKLKERRRKTTRKSLPHVSGCNNSL